MKQSRQPCTRQLWLRHLAGCLEGPQVVGQEMISNGHEQSVADTDVPKIYNAFTALAVMLLNPGSTSMLVLDLTFLQRWRRVPASDSSSFHHVDSRICDRSHRRNKQAQSRRNRLSIVNTRIRLPMSFLRTETELNHARAVMLRAMHRPERLRALSSASRRCKSSPLRSLCNANRFINIWIVRSQLLSLD
jgi:hypothetical protein